MRTGDSFGNVGRRKSHLVSRIPLFWEVSILAAFVYLKGQEPEDE